MRRRLAPCLLAHRGCTAAAAPFQLLRAAAPRALSSRSASADPRRDAARAAHLDEALRLVHAHAVARYDESVDMAIRLNVDVKRSDERVRGMALLPHGTGRSVRVAVFARGDLADEAREAGADVVGAEDLVEEVLRGRLDFERVLAAPDVMVALAKIARTLGPKGLMPNPKRGTVTVRLADAVRRAKAGEVEFRAQKTGIVHASIGRVAFEHAQLRDNALAFLCAAARMPPRLRVRTRVRRAAARADRPLVSRSCARAQGLRAGAATVTLQREAAHVDRAQLHAGPRREARSSVVVSAQSGVRPSSAPPRDERYACSDQPPASSAWPRAWPTATACGER